VIHLVLGRDGNGSTMNVEGVWDDESSAHTHRQQLESNYSLVTVESYEIE